MSYEEMLGWGTAIISLAMLWIIIGAAIWIDIVKSKRGFDD